jgi:hypothetical protein
MGLSTLYLAFGFLEWYDADASDKKAFAPLLLLPVSLQKGKVRGKTVFSLSVREGGAEANLSLQKLLEQRARVLPDFEVDEEASRASIESYLDQVTNAIDGLKSWKIHRWLVLGHFSFGRFAMYADLDQGRCGDVTSHDLGGSILHGVEQKRDPNTLPGIPEDYFIDDPEIEQVAPFLIHDSDASQHSALVDAMRGKNLVVQGPPGTGKSQTITNVIANLLAHGKRVLFLAEKLAALEVVKRRLDRAWLGHFCLELHSEKASPRSVIAVAGARRPVRRYERSDDLPAACVAHRRRAASRRLPVRLSGAGDRQQQRQGRPGPRRGCGVVFGVTVPNIPQGSPVGTRVVLLDWDIRSLAQGGVGPWLQHVRERTMAWFHRPKPLTGLPSAHIEPAGNGYAIIEAARSQELNPVEIDTKFVALGKDGRALAVEPHATDGRVKLGRSALERRSNYRGVVANHLVRQVTGFRAFDKDAYRPEDDLFDAAMYAVLVSLGRWD